MRLPFQAIHRQRSGQDVWISRKSEGGEGARLCDFYISYLTYLATGVDVSENCTVEIGINRLDVNRFHRSVCNNHYFVRPWTTFAFLFDHCRFISLFVIYNHICAFSFKKQNLISPICSFCFERALLLNTPKMFGSVYSASPIQNLPHDGGAGSDSRSFDWVTTYPTANATGFTLTRLHKTTPTVVLQELSTVCVGWRSLHVACLRFESDFSHLHSCVRASNSGQLHSYNSLQLLWLSFISEPRLCKGSSPFCSWQTARNWCTRCASLNTWRVRW